MSKYNIKPLKPEGLKTYSLRSRKSKVTSKDFAKTWVPDDSFAEFIDSLPDILAGKEFKEFVSLVKAAKENNKMIIFSLGAHVIKVGLNPIIIKMMEEGWITSLALNGAGIIHDFEIAFSGKTSEDVDLHIKDGQFGMALETGEILNEALLQGDSNCGMGEIIGRMINSSDFPHKNLSLLSAAYERGLPVTVHAAIGTDIIHFHPKARGDLIGKATLRDFYLFCSLVEKLNDGGIFINAGSAVILPEIFLKAVSFVRNKGKALDSFTTAVFDFKHLYRPYQNVIKRPVGEKGRGFYFIGHHEIMIPLLAAALRS